MGVNLGALGDLGDIGKQFLVWQVLGQIAQAVLGPVLIEVQQDVSGRINRLALSPADAAEAVVKGHQDESWGSAEAALSGVDGERFQVLVDSAGEPPGLELLLELGRRGIIPWNGMGADAATVEQGIAESRVKIKWIEAIVAAKYRPLDPGQAVAAALRGNLPPDQALTLAEQSGVSPDHFQVMLHNAGRPPSPGELLELLKRGEIPLAGTGPDALTFQQGIFEGDTKDKWWELYAALGRYIPPPRTVTALLREGSISEARARQFLEWAGLTAEDADSYIAAASKQTAHAAKEITKSEVLQLYSEGIVTAAAAAADLVKLGMAEADAKELIQLQDVKRTRQYQAQVVSKIRSLYLGHHITEQEATQALREGGSDASTITHLLTLWGLERQQPQERLTAGQIASAVYYKALTADEGYAALQGIGYSPFDAWIILADRLHGSQNLPPRPPLPAWSG